MRHIDFYAAMIKAELAVVYNVISGAMSVLSVIIVDVTEQCVFAVFVRNVCHRFC